jgi:hypothetical protein
VPLDCTSTPNELPLAGNGPDAKCQMLSAKC